MAFSDPQSITIDGNATSLPRVSTRENASDYRAGDDTIALTVSNQYGRRVRRTFRIDHSKIASDPFIPAQNSKVSMSTYIVIDEPPVGYTNEEIVDITVGMLSMLTASSNAALVKLASGEN